MNGALQPPTTFDTWTGVTSAAVYLTVGLGVFARAPRDSRAQTFLTIAIASLAPYLTPAALGHLGYGTLLTVVASVTAISLAVGSVALFHFTQVFPSRRPWIASRGAWLAPAYIGLPLGALLSAWAILPFVRMEAAMAGAPGSGGLGAVSSEVALFLLTVLIPTLLVIGVILPFVALVSLYKSWQEAARDGRDGARVTTLTILISQLAGGVLTILVVPLLHLISPAGLPVLAASLLLFGFGLLFPIAYAVGVWKYRLVLQAD